jgi:hypothetical protein
MLMHAGPVQANARFSAKSVVLKKHADATKLSPGATEDTGKVASGGGEGSWLNRVSRS